MPVLILVLAGLIMTLTPCLAEGGQLAALRWKARPLVIVSDARDDPRVARQLAAFADMKVAADERDIRLLQEVGSDGPLRRQLGVGQRSFAVVLVGKDGGVKNVWREPVDPRRIFTIIDGMPMRQHEMKTRSF